MSVQETTISTERNSERTELNLPVKPERLMQLMFGFAPPLILEAALQHHIFDVLQDAPKTVEQMSQETGASVRFPIRFPYCLQRNPIS